MSSGYANEARITSSTYKPGHACTPPNETPFIIKVKSRYLRACMTNATVYSLSGVWIDSNMLISNGVIRITRFLAISCMLTSTIADRLICSCFYIVKISAIRSASPSLLKLIMTCGRKIVTLPLNRRSVIYAARGVHHKRDAFSAHTFTAHRGPCTSRIVTSIGLLCCEFPSCWFVIAPLLTMND